MEIQVICRSQERKGLIEGAAKFYAQELNLGNSKFSLTIQNLPNLGKVRNTRGEVFQSGYREIYMVLESRLSWPQMLLTLAHEMVHVKQIARGQYRGRVARNGRLLSVWCGKTVRTEYMKRPWEIEAFRRQEELLGSLMETVTKPRKKKG